MVAELLPLYEAVFWIDTDATIIQSTHYKEFFEDKHFFFSPNPPPIFNNKHLDFLTAPLCAGVWAVRNSPEGNNLMKHWKSSYDPSFWKNDNGKWTCNGTYGGRLYEQGSFELNIYRNADLKKLIRPYPYHKFNYVARRDKELNDSDCPNDVFCLHYWSGQRTQISEHWKKPLIFL